jgi:hypothetical protein
MLVNWDSARETTIFKPQAFLKMNYSSYKQTALKLLAMLQESRDLLEFNSKKLFPK